MPHQFPVGFGGGGGLVRLIVLTQGIRKRKENNTFFALVVLGFNTIPGCIYLLVNVGRTSTCHTERRKSVEGNSHYC